ncbi:MAG: hypothetical protein J6W06_07425 [Bacteroidales bacterium]|nr:hypothetical protein [Bacteroidales bacterium]
MKKFIAIGVFASLMLTLFSFNVFAQNTEKTAYQKKVHELAEKYYCIVNHNTENPKNLNFTDQYTMAIFTGKVYDEESFNNFAGMLILTKVNVMSTSQMESLKKRMDNDLKTAAKLKTSVDIQREKEEQQKKMEKEKRSKEIGTDKGYLYAIITRDFNKWCTKGEYEKTSEHDTRLQTLSAYIFDSICRENISLVINNKRIRITKGSYDAENEQFPIKYESWTDRSAAYYSETQFDGYIGGSKKYSYLDLSFNLKVPVSEAKVLSDLSQIYYEDKLGFYDNSIVFRKVKLKDGYNGLVYGPMFLPLLNCTDLIIYADSMTLNSQYLDGHSFNFTKYKKGYEWEKCSIYFKSYSDYIFCYNKGTQFLVDEVNKRKHFVQYYKYFKDYNEFLSFYKNGEEDFLKEANKRVKYEEYKDLFKDKDEYSSFYDQGGQAFDDEVNFRKKCMELKPIFPASADMQEYISLYDRDYEKIDASVEYYKEMKDKYLVKYFDNKENEFYSTFLKCYVKGGGKTSFDTEIARISWYRKYKNLYSSESEFNMIFKSGKTRFQNDIDARIYVSKYSYDIRKLSDKDRKTLVTNTLYNYEHGITNTMKIVIDGDAKMKKEFESNGSYFSDTKEFFNSYIGENYKSDLKAKKKAAKASH